MFTNIDTPCGDYYRIDPQPYDHLKDHVLGLVEQVVNKSRDELDLDLILFNLEEIAWGFNIRFPQVV